MPYIPTKQRQELDDAILELASKVNGLVSMETSPEGLANYAITRLMLEVFRDRPTYPHNYAKFNTMIGVLEAAKLEFYRRMVAPYEDGKKDKNGDVFFL